MSAVCAIAIRALGETRSMIRRGERLFLAAVFLFHGAGIAFSQQEITGDAEVALAEPVLTVQDGQSGRQIKSIAFSRDGRLVLTAGGPDYRAVLWEVASGRQIRDFRGHSSFITSAALSSDNRYVVTAGQDRTARLWDAATGRELRRFEAEETIEAVAISPDGRHLLTGSWDGAAQLWKVESGEHVRRFPLSQPIIDDVAFSIKGDVVAVAGDEEIRLFRIDSEDAFASCQRPSGSPRQLQFSTDGKVLTAVFAGAAQVWRSSDGTLLNQIDVESPLAFSHDAATLLANEADRTTALFDAATGKPVRRYLRTLASSAAAFTPDDTRIFCAGDDVASMCRVDSGEVVRSFHSFIPRLNATASSTDGRYLASAQSDGTIRIWDFEKGGQVGALEGNSGIIQAVALDPSGKYLLSGGSDGVARLWLLERSTEIGGSSRRLGRRIGAVEFSSNGRDWLVQTLYSGTVFLKHDGYGNPDGGFRTKTDQEIGYVATLSPDDRWILTNRGEKGACLLSAEDGKEKQRLEGHDDLVRAVCFSPDGKYAVTGSYDKTACLWEVATGKMLRRFRGHEDSITTVAVSPDNKHVLTGSGRMSGGDTTARLWDAETGEEIWRLEGHRGGVCSVRFLREGRIILTAGEDGSARLWNIAERSELCRLFSLQNGNWMVATPDGRFDASNLADVEGLHWVSPDRPFLTLPVELYLPYRYEPRLLTRLLDGEDLGEPHSLAKLDTWQPKATIRDVAVHPEGTYATVTVHVEIPNSTTFAALHDVCLFRDGQWVASEEDAVSRSSDDAEMEFEFRDVKLPAGEPGRAVAFSVYALNTDRIKGPTDRRMVTVPLGHADRKGAAYIVTIGMNDYQSPNWNLQYAVNDARMLGERLPKAIAGSHRFDKVVQVGLLSERVDGEQARPTKETIRRVFAVLAGEEQPEALLPDVPGVEQLAEARPEDLVVVTFSGHGCRTANGLFYLLPYDIGTDAHRIDEAILQRCISSDELARWMRGIDCRDFVLVLDACHSAAAFDSPGFRPGPMGSRGLGQLAYNKGARILAASQASGVAIESDRIRMGLLTHALIEEAPGQATHEHAVDDMTLRRWLEFPVDQVPTIYEEAKARTTAKNSPEPETNEKGLTLIEEVESETVPYQRPVLFDFTRHSREISLIPGYRTNTANAAAEELSAAEKLLAPGTIEAANEAIEGFRSANFTASQAEDLRLMARAERGLARAYRRIADNRLAAQSYRNCVALYDRVGDRHESALRREEFGEFCGETDDRVQALELFYEALRLARSLGDHELTERVLIRIARLYHAAGEGAVAAAHFTDALQLAPGRIAVLRERGLAYGSMGATDEALADLDQVLERDPRDDAALTYRGNVRRDMEDYDAAIADYTRALEIDAGSTSALSERAWTFYLKRDFNRSISDYDALVDLDQEFVSVRANVHERIGRLDAALADFERAAKLHPVDSKGWADYGRVCVKSAEWAKASACFSKIQSLQPDDAWAWHTSALVELARSDRAEFRRICAQMVDDFADSEDASNLDAVAFTAALAPDCVKDIAPIAQLAKDLSAGSPESWAYLETLGAIQYRAGDYSQAVETLQKAIAHHGKGGSAWMHLFLAMSHQRLGNAADAQQRLEKANEIVGMNTRNDLSTAADALGSWERAVRLRVLCDEAHGLILPPPERATP
ncbi:MAG: caspase family protein [Pirellulaceae bacterium]